MLAVTHHIIVNVPPSDGGASLGSVLVLAGGVAAAFAALGSAILTARAADRRLAATLSDERVRLDQRLRSEQERLDKQFSHEHALVQRKEKRVMVAETARIVARSCRQVSRVSRGLLSGETVERDELDTCISHLTELREESGALATTFDFETPIMLAFNELVSALNEALPWPKEIPLSDAKKEELTGKLKALGATEEAFWVAARKETEAA